MSIQKAMKIIADIDTLSENRTTPVWMFLKEVEKKNEQLKKLASEVHILEPDEIEFRHMVFPGSTKYNLLGRGFKQQQIERMKKDVFFKTFFRFKKYFLRYNLTFEGLSNFGRTRKLEYFHFPFLKSIED